MQLMRMQLAVASGSGEGFLPQYHYDQIFTAHGVILFILVVLSIWIIWSMHYHMMIN